MMKQMKNIATQTLFGAQEIKAYMKRATLTSFGITMGLFTSAFALGLYITSLSTSIIEKEAPIRNTPGTTVLIDYNTDNNTTIDLIPISIDVITTFIKGTQTVAGHFVAMPDMDMVIDASKIATVSQIGRSSATIGETDVDDIDQSIDVAFGEPENFTVDVDVAPAQQETFEEWEVSESPNVDISEISSNIVYPRIAKQAGIEGLVLLNVLVGSDGTIKNVKVEHSDNLLLNEAAISAVKRSTYTPAIQNGTPCACWISIPIEFRLN